MTAIFVFFGALIVVISFVLITTALSLFCCCVVFLLILDLYFCCICLYLIYFFFFKQKTAYEMRISDWSSDVCSSDLLDDSIDLLPIHEYKCDDLKIHEDRGGGGNRVGENRPSDLTGYHEGGAMAMVSRTLGNDRLAGIRITNAVRKREVSSEIVLGLGLGLQTPRTIFPIH